MSRYADLFAYLRKIARETDDEHVDPSHALQRVAVLERLVSGLIWLNAQTLKELAKRDGVECQ